MSLQELMRQRRDKLERWRALGVEPFAYRYEPSHCAADVVGLGDAVTEEPGETVRLAGRLMTKRGHGKAGFAHLLDGSGRIQVYCRADQLGEQFERYKLLDVGDWVGVEGPVFRTRTGEITVRAERLDLLSKSLRPLPEKWHGLKDPDTRYRQRYTDLFMNLEVRETFRRRAKLTSGIRSFLDSRDYLEVETPVLQPLYGGAFARPFTTTHNALGMDLYLRISNELYLKRLVVGGFERVYEFARDFRNEGIDRTHSPEFTMLEFYQAYADVHDMMDLTEALVGDAIERATGSKKIEYQGRPVDFTAPWPRISMLEAVSEKVGERVDDLDPDRLAAIAKRHHVEVRKGAGAGALLDELFGELIQPDIFHPTFVVDFPIEISPLARISREKPQTVERFEVMVGGAELANAFSEQNDPDAQRRAFEGQAVLRDAGDDEAQQLDEDYLRALEYGMPPTGGCGIGFDRLVMLATDSRTIRDVVLFPTLRPEEGRGEPHEDEDEAEPEATTAGSETPTS